MFNCREQATVPSGTLPSALSSKSRDDFGRYFRFSLNQEMGPGTDLDPSALDFISFISSSRSKPTSLSCFGWMNSIGTVTLLSSARASQVRTTRRRRESTVMVNLRWVAGESWYVDGHFSDSKNMPLFPDL